MLLIQIKNDGTGDMYIGNYDYSVFINAHIVETGRIEAHNRFEGWKELVKLFTEEISKKENEEE